MPEIRGLNNIILYDKTRVKEYIKERKGWLTMFEEKVLTDTIGREIILELNVKSKVDKIIINGVEYIKK